MEELLERIFQEIIYYQPDTVVVERKVSKEIDSMVLDKKQKLSEDEYEEYRSILNEVAFIAGTKYFWLESI